MSTVSEKIDAKLVKELREKSGAPMGDCLKALQESKGEMEEAFVILRKRGMASAQKKSSRSTNEGAVGQYIHAGGKIGVLVEVNCESDFVARTDDFQELLKDIAMHIAATDPRYIRREDVTPEDLEREKEIYRAQTAALGKPAKIVDQIVEGKMGKFYEEVCLLEQPFIKEQSQSIKDLIASKVGKLGENITVRRFAEKLANLTGVITTAEALERKPPERRWGSQMDPADEIQVAGMILGVRVQKSKRDQKHYAQAALEDATGKIDLICFSRDYERLQGQLKMEAPVLVRGVLMGDEDAAPKIAVSSIQALEEVQVKLPTGVRIRINLDRATEEILARLKSAADAAPGPAKLMLHLDKKDEYSVILEPEGMSVAADRTWVSRVEEIAGKGSVQALG